MKHLLLSVLCLLFLSAPAFPATLDEAAAQIAKMFPKTGIDGFSPSPIPGLYEVTAGSQVFYFSPEGYLVLGEIWSKDGRSLTAEKRDQIVAEKVRALPLEKAVTIGDGPNQVIEFTDPDCSYCRRLDAFLSGRTDITRHIFFFPLNSHPTARDKTQYILCNKNRQAAKKEVFTGKWDKTPPPLNHCTTTLLGDHLRLGEATGVRGTPTLWVNGVRIGGANIEAISSILNNANPKAERKENIP